MPATIAVDARKLADFGIGTYIRQLIEEFARCDVDHRYVLLVAPGHDLDPASLDERFRLCVERAPVYSLRGLFSVSRTLRREGVDLFHATHYVLPLRLPCPAVVTIHDLIHLLFPQYLPNRGALVYAKFMLGHAVRTARRVITVSEHSAKDLRSHYGIEPPRLRVIANGVDSSFYGSGEGRATENGSMEDESADVQVLRRHRIEPGYFLFVGNPKPHKNLERALRAFAMARRRSEGHRSRRLVLVGSDASDLAALAATSGDPHLTQNVHPLGFVSADDLPALYRNASQLVFPSLYEGFGLPALEAMAAGTRVLTSRDSAMSEITGNCALLVDPRSVEEIRDGMLELDREPENERGRRRTRGRERARAFTWAQAAERTLEVYAEALAEAETSKSGGRR